MFIYEDYLLIEYYFGNSFLTKLFLFCVNFNNFYNVFIQYYLNILNKLFFFFLIYDRIHL